MTEKERRISILQTQLIVLEKKKTILERKTKLFPISYKPNIEEKAISEEDSFEMEASLEDTYTAHDKSHQSIL